MVNLDHAVAHNLLQHVCIQLIQKRLSLENTKSKFQNTKSETKIFCLGLQIEMCKLEMLVCIVDVMLCIGRTTRVCFNLTFASKCFFRCLPVGTSSILLLREFSSGWQIIINFS